MTRRSLGDLLLEEGLVDEMALRHLRSHARRSNIGLVRAVIEKGNLADDKIAELLMRKLRLGAVNWSLEDRDPDEDALRKVSHDFADARRILPLTIDYGNQAEGRQARIRVAMADPLDHDAVEEIELATGCAVEPLVARSDEVGQAIVRRYRHIITKLIVRSGSPASPQIQLKALVDLLEAKNVLPKGAFDEAVAELLRSVE